MEVASHALTAATSAAGAATGSAAGTAVVSALLTAAGASATVPVAGWIAAGVAVVAAGIVSLVTGIKKGTVKNIQAVAQAKAIGIPSAEASAFPAYTKRALRWSSSKRTKRARRLQRRLARRPHGRRAWRYRTRLQVLGVIEAVDRAEARGQMHLVEQALQGPSSTPSSTAKFRRMQARQARREAVIAAQPDPTPLYWAVGGGVVVVAAAILLSGGRNE